MNISKTLWIRYGEIGLKKGNRYQFENQLKTNILRAIDPNFEIELKIDQKKLFLLCKTEDSKKILDKITHVPGIVSIRSCDTFEAATPEILAQEFKDLLNQWPISSSATRFAIRAHRTDKTFSWNSNDIGRELGSIAVINNPSWQVDLTNPETTIHVLIIDGKALISHEEYAGPGGLPVGSAGKLGVLLSGGIDSPVAAYQMQRRGAELQAVYFHSFPYTGDQALNKVRDLSKVLSIFQKNFPLHIVHFTQIQEAIRDNCNPKYSVILNRRMMMRIAERIATQHKLLGLITGESLGQVASQTLENMHAVGSSTSLQIYRPLIGTDKQDIIHTATRIGTLDISNRPFEDCCTLFVDKHPVIRAKMDTILEDESKLDMEALIAASLEQTTVEVF